MGSLSDTINTAAYTITLREIAFVCHPSVSLVELQASHDFLHFFLPVRRQAEINPEQCSTCQCKIETPPEPIEAKVVLEAQPQPERAAKEIVCAIESHKSITENVQGVYSAHLMLITAPKVCT